MGAYSKDVRSSCRTSTFAPFTFSWMSAVALHVNRSFHKHDGGNYKA